MSTIPLSRNHLSMVSLVDVNLDKRFFSIACLIFLRFHLFITFFGYRNNLTLMRSSRPFSIFFHATQVFPGLLCLHSHLRHCTHMDTNVEDSSTWGAELTPDNPFFTNSVAEWKAFATLAETVLCLLARQRFYYLHKWRFVSIQCTSSRLIALSRFHSYAPVRA